jgi:hypothetical protein
LAALTSAALGFICVLHTWDQTLRDRFHLHLIPGGALSLRSRPLDSARRTFLFPVKALSLFRGKFLGLIDQASPEQLRFQAALLRSSHPCFC